MSPEGPVRDGNGAGFELIETLRWEPARGFVRLERHMARLAASARELGFELSPAGIHRALRDAVGGGALLRVRLTLAQEGKSEVTAQPYAPLAPDAVWTLKIAETRLDANDPLLRHKTTRRTVYDAARAEFSREEADEVILLNQRGEVCEGTITNVFIDMGDGILLTPALRCGLLPGVFRGELLESGKAKEAVLTEDDLRRANAIFVGNSLRGLIRSRLARTRCSVLPKAS
jgi:4-amino-4-deoxychorismate lyase